MTAPAPRDGSAGRPARRPAALVHAVNLALLPCFATLAITGVRAFLEPFSLTWTRVHLVFGAATATLVLLHLASRVAYFRRVAAETLRGPSGGRRRVPRSVVALVAFGYGALLAAAINGATPVSAMVGLGYEARHRAEIVRPRPDTAWERLGPTLRVGQRPAEAPGMSLEVEVEYATARLEEPAVAIWAETTRGALIETLFLDARVAFSDDPVFGGVATPREAILPVWRHRYTAQSGLDPAGEVDAVTQPTPEHRFSLAQHLTTDAREVVLFLELNVPGDPDAAWPDPRLGQPSVLYSTLIDLERPERYHLLRLTGHGGDAVESGRIAYDLERVTTAADLIEKVLVRIEPPPRTG